MQYLFQQRETISTATKEREDVHLRDGSYALGGVVQHVVGLAQRSYWFDAAAEPPPPVQQRERQGNHQGTNALKKKLNISSVDFF